MRRGGFDGRVAAVAALEALTSPAALPAPGLSTGEWLGRWLASRVSLRASTARSYAAHIRGYLVPYLGGIPLAALTVGDVQAMFTAVIRDEACSGRILGHWFDLGLRYRDDRHSCVSRWLTGCW